jgi:hypothetical protein
MPSAPHAIATSRVHRHLLNGASSLCASLTLLLVALRSSLPSESSHAYCILFTLVVVGVDRRTGVPSADRSSDWAPPASVCLSLFPTLATLTAINDQSRDSGTRWSSIMTAARLLVPATRGRLGKQRRATSGTTSRKRVALSARGGHVSSDENDAMSESAMLVLVLLLFCGMCRHRVAYDTHGQARVPRGSRWDYLHEHVTVHPSSRGCCALPQKPPRDRFIHLNG